MYTRPSCSWSIPLKETENRFYHKSSVTYNPAGMNDVVDSTPVAMLVSATGTPEYERPYVASFRAGRTQCMRPLSNCSLPSPPKCPATTPFLPLSQRGLTGRVPSARDASGFSDPPPRLGVDALVAVRSGVRPARSAGVHLQCVQE